MELKMDGDKRYTIMIVDDIPSNINIVHNALENQGYRVSIAKNGKEAIERVTLSMPDLILLDILMPGMDGYETCLKLKDDEETKDIPVIFMSALYEAFDKAKGFEVGGVDFITKPVEPIELLARVKTHLTVSRLQIDLQKANTTLEEKVLIRTNELRLSNEHLKKEIEERRQTEYELKEAYDIISRSPGVAFRWKNEEGWPVAFVSPNVKKLFGYPEKDFISEKMRYAQIIHSEDLKKMTREVDGYSKENERTQFTLEPYRIVTAGGGIKWVEEKTSIRRDKNGFITHFQGIVEDITERITAQKEKEKLERQLLQAQKMEAVGRLAGGVAHDFNNMLSVILGYAEIALKWTDPARRPHKAIREIMKAAHRSADITRQLLAFARKQPIAPKVLDLNKSLTNMLNMIQRLIGEDIHLIWLPAKDLWSIKIDPSQIDQILVNLCVNARDAIQGVGRLTIETGMVGFDNSFCKNHPGFIPGDFVFLSVSDDGCGMDEETLQKIFEPFFTTKDTDRGTGLGLATVYGIVKQNCGCINVYSEPDIGTTFKIYLPRYRIVDEQGLEKSIAASDVKGSETILLLEDEPMILDMIKTMLESQGYSVLTAIKPSQAIDLAREYGDRIHLLITDVVLPDMNGVELVQYLQPLYPSLKYLFMSGYTANVIAHHDILNEGVNFLQKPFSENDLFIKVRETLNDADCNT